MSSMMSQFKETANVHMRQEMERGQWVCQCEACHAIRSLVGLDKMLAVRPLVRELQRAENRLAELPAGSERRNFLEQYLRLHDQLADELAK
ncbi:MAG TPA: hypothetical protein VKE98_15225 [Gemmataceae bacterium]|nr:hypothetical protein [Gemmataceae bacterium]